MKNYFFTVLCLALFISAVSAECLSLPFRYTGDYRQFFLYLTKDIAVGKNTTSLPDGTDKTDYGIVKAHWVGEPESADSTGDRADETIVQTPVRIGMDKEKKFILIYGSDYDGVPINSSNRVWIISLTTDKINKSTDLAGLKSELIKDHLNLPEIKLEPIEVFFDHQMIERLAEK